MFIRELGRAGDPCVLLLHGQIYGPELFRPLWERLAATRHVLVPDLPGNGRTPIVDTYSFGSVQSLLERELLLRGIQQLSIAGYSLGGYHALALALRRGVRVERLALIASTAGLDEPSKQSFAEHARLIRQGSNLAEEVVPALHLSAGFMAKNPGAATEVVAAIRALSRETFALECEQAAAMRDLRPELARLDVPTLVCVGSEDRAVGVRSCEAMAKAIKGSAFESIPGAGHQLFIERGAYVAERLARFLLAAPV